jgi:hypothetical protein
MLHYDSPIIQHSNHRTSEVPCTEHITLLQNVWVGFRALVPQYTLRTAMLTNGVKERELSHAEGEGLTIMKVKVVCVKPKKTHASRPISAVVTLPCHAVISTCCPYSKFRQKKELDQHLFTFLGYVQAKFKSQATHIVHCRIL